jgi:tetratricopeptide (TPR) repeat protein
MYECCSSSALDRPLNAFFSHPSLAQAAKISACAFRIGYGVRVGAGRDPAQKGVQIPPSATVTANGAGGASSKPTAAQRDLARAVGELIEAQDWRALLSREAEALQVADVLRRRAPADAVAIYGSLGHAHMACLAQPVAIYADHGATPGWQETAYGNPCPPGRRQPKSGEGLHSRSKVARANFQGGACRMHADHPPGFRQQYSNAPHHKPEPCRASLFPGTHMEELNGDAAKAIDHYLAALVVTKESQDRAGEAEVYSSLGMAYRKIADYPKAITFHEARLAIALELGDRAAEGSAYLSLGLCYYSLERFHKAVERLEGSLDIAREMCDLELERKASDSLERSKNMVALRQKQGQHYVDHLAN